jgi:hypothetical protein
VSTFGNWPAATLATLRPAQIGEHANALSARGVALIVLLLRVRVRVEHLKRSWRHTRAAKRRAEKLHVLAKQHDLMQANGLVGPAWAEVFRRHRETAEAASHLSSEEVGVSFLLYYHLGSQCLYR